MKTIILAAGYATRLYPLTKNKPKALLPIGSKPLMDHLLDKLALLAKNPEVVLITNDRFTAQFTEWAKPYPNVTIVNDGTTSNDNRLGAIGDLQFAIQKAGVDDDILVLASDNLFEGDLADFARFAQSHPDTACIGAYDIGDPQRASKKFGVFELDQAKRITAIEEKPEHPKTSWVSMGIYYFPKSSLKFVTEYLSSTQKQDAPGFYATWLLEKLPVYAYIFKGKWYDIGSLEQLEEASKNYVGQS